MEFVLTRKAGKRGRRSQRYEWWLDESISTAVSKLYERKER
ncbi:MAG TPA: hypothetical protein VMJ64_02145 [Anaerolineales bacterium]|nr:hypothetical protein [Anaerolineales bacterium]